MEQAEGEQVSKNPPSHSEVLRAIIARLDALDRHANETSITSKGLLDAIRGATVCQDYMKYLDSLEVPK